MEKLLEREGNKKWKSRCKLEWRKLKNECEQKIIRTGR
jgi:hypothetical protein